VRHVEVYEHPGYLDRALQDAQRRVMIIAPWVCHEVVDAPFVPRLRGLLDRGVERWVGYGISAEETYRKGRRGEADRDAERALETLARDFESFRLTRLGDTHAKVLVCDSRFSILTSFNWLSFRGASDDLHFRDERGFYVGLKPQVDTLFDSYADRFPARTGPVTSPSGLAAQQNE
jgi:phosphatidylserine/phosphatidylglycerophosphate/cardiolipin synthase-like enzyme